MCLLHIDVMFISLSYVSQTAKKITIVIMMMRIIIMMMMMAIVNKMPMMMTTITFALMEITLLFKCHLGFNDQKQKSLRHISEVLASVL